MTPMVKGATPAISALERAGISHTVHPYELAGDDERSYGEAVAAALGVPGDRLFKTLVALVDGDPVVAVVPVDGNLDMKRLARASGGKRAGMAPPEVAERLTGYVVGGVSPLGQKRRLSMVVDEAIGAHDTVFVSAGRRGLQVELAPDDLLAATGASVASIADRGGS
ncbi:MAG TPA: Cys-tRNA(Pro) deacylase [Acidimicrobiia bacterium]|nr:Cys-tRNA(Pro) deacylase [Acidimicrobiia bacterium]